MLELNGLLGKYQIEKKLGSGGFGTVYLAEDTMLRVKRALKIPHRNAAQLEKMTEEGRVQTRLLDHPNIVKLLTLESIDGIFVMVMEYIEGTDLEKMIDEQETLDISAALHYLRQILSALEFAHNHRILHRDIRPSNILITKAGNQVKITDFGTSTLLDDAKPFATTRIGSPPYMAPEQFEGKAVFASDLYSAGCLFYEMVTGFPPIVLANPMEIYNRARAGDFPSLESKNHRISSELNRVIMKALAPAARDRYPTAGEFLAELDRQENRSADIHQVMEDIHHRIQVRETRIDHVCWNCRKSFPASGRNRCPYCGEER